MHNSRSYVCHSFYCYSSLYHTLHGITVYTFIKCGKRKLIEKFYIIGILIFVAWLVSISLATLEQVGVVSFGIGHSNGFCVIEFMAMFTFSVDLVAQYVPIIILLIHAIITLAFSILT